VLSFVCVVRSYIIIIMHTLSVSGAACVGASAHGGLLPCRICAA
jgi:hypothetical protein